MQLWVGWVGLPVLMLFAPFGTTVWVWARCDFLAATAAKSACLRKGLQDCRCFVTCIGADNGCCCLCLCCVQALFFTYTGLSTPDGFKWMGVMTMGITALYMLMYFPMW